MTRLVMCEVLCGVCQKPFVLVVSHCSAVSKVHFNQQRLFSVVVCSKKPLCSKATSIGSAANIKSSQCQTVSPKPFQTVSILSPWALVQVLLQMRNHRVPHLEASAFGAPVVGGAFVMIATEAKMSVFLL